MRKKEFIKNVINNRRVVFRPDYRDVGAILLFILLVPYIISFLFGNVEKGKGTEEESAGTEAGIFQEDRKKAEYIVYNKTAAGTEMIPLETYLAGRLPATINMEYEMEALKAQAVVLRTELMKQAGEGKYIYVESGTAKTGEAEYERSMEAVGSTRGMFLEYGGEIITAPYFAVSAGATRNGNEVFGSEDYAYLKSVVCDRDFTSEDYTGGMRMSRYTFWNRLGEFMPDMEYEESLGAEEQLVLERDRAGYVTEVSLNGKSVSGEIFREAFALNSSCFELEQEGEMVIIKTKGVGHGFGLCQYGANEAAKRGSDYIDILNYFFSDIVIEKIGESG